MPIKIEAPVQLPESYVQLYRTSTLESFKNTFKDIRKTELPNKQRRFCSDKIFDNRLRGSVRALLKRNPLDTFKPHFIQAAVMLILEKSLKQNLAACTSLDIRGYFTNEIETFTKSGKTLKGESLSLLRALYSYVTPLLTLEQLSIEQRQQIRKEIDVSFNRNKRKMPLQDNTPTQSTSKKLHTPSPAPAKTPQGLHDQKGHQEKADDEREITKTLYKIYNKSNFILSEPGTTSVTSSASYSHRHMLEILRPVDRYFQTYYYRTTTLIQFKEAFPKIKPLSGIAEPYQFHSKNISLISLESCWNALIQKDPENTIKRHFIEATIMLLLQEIGKENLEKLTFQDLHQYFSKNLERVSSAPQDFGRLLSLFQTMYYHLSPFLTQFKKTEQEGLEKLLRGNTSPTLASSQLSEVEPQKSSPITLEHPEPSLPWITSSPSLDSTTSTFNDSGLLPPFLSEEPPQEVTISASVTQLPTDSIWSNPQRNQFLTFSDKPIIEPEVAPITEKQWWDEMGW